MLDAPEGRTVVGWWMDTHLPKPPQTPAPAPTQQPQATHAAPPRPTPHPSDITLERGAAQGTHAQRSAACPARTLMKVGPCWPPVCSRS